MFHSRGNHLASSWLHQQLPRPVGGWDVSDKLLPQRQSSGARWSLWPVRTG